MVNFALVDSEIIEKLVNTYFRKEMRERILYEFKKKPIKIETRIAHELQDILDERLTVLFGAKLTEEEVIAELKKHTKDKEATLISTDYNGLTKPLKEAVDICFDWPGGSIL